MFLTALLGVNAHLPFSALTLPLKTEVAKKEYSWVNTGHPCPWTIDNDSPSEVASQEGAVGRGIRVLAWLKVAAALLNPTCVLGFAQGPIWPPCQLELTGALLSLTRRSRQQLLFGGPY